MDFTEISHTINSNLRTVNITPKFGINIYGGFGLVLLPTIQLNIANEFEHKLTLSDKSVNTGESHNLVFNESNNYEIDRTYESQKEISLFNANFGAGAKYSLELSNTIILQAEAYYQIPITSLTEDNDWKFEAYVASFGISYRIPSVETDDETAPLLLKYQDNLDSIRILNSLKDKRIALIQDSIANWKKDSLERIEMARIQKEIELARIQREKDSLDRVKNELLLPPDEIGTEGECWKLNFGSNTDKDWINELLKELKKLDIESEIDEFLDERTGLVHYRVFTVNCWDDKESAIKARSAYKKRLRKVDFKLKYIRTIDIMKPE